MISVRNLFIVAIVGSFIAGAFLASPDLRAYAANTVFSTDIVDGQVKTVDIANGNVTNAKLAANSVTTTKIGTSAVTNSDIAANAVTSGKIADGAVTNADLAGSAVTTNKIADGTINARDVSNTFMTFRTLLDDAEGNAAGWNPDGATRSFTITDSAFDASWSIVIINTQEIVVSDTCSVDYRTGNTFEIHCAVDSAPIASSPPEDGARLDYMIISFPPFSVPTSTTTQSEEMPPRGQ